jgi:hypothetical protein
MVPILGPYPALNFSKYPGYGAAYGANFIAPTSLISAAGYNAPEPRTFTSRRSRVNNMRSFMDGNFPLNFSDNSAGVSNSEVDRHRCRLLFLSCILMLMQGCFKTRGAFQANEQ